MNTYISPAKPVKPRNAASLVLYERKGDDIYVLMGKRAKGHRFLPDVYVFPGGRVDDEDFSLTASAPLKKTVSDLLSKPGEMSHAIASAAIRETFEETGLIIGDVVEELLVPDLSNLEFIVRAITPVQSPIRFNTRFLMLDATHATGSLAGSGELINLQWVTLEKALRMPVVDVTEFVLQEVGLRLSGESLNKSEIPLFTYYKGKPFIRRG